MRVREFLLALLMAFLPAYGATALTITLSDVTSEPGTNPVEHLVADLIFDVSCTATACTLTLTVDNRTDDNDPLVTYDINEIGFNATWAQIDSPELTLLSATHSVNNDVFSG